MPKFKVCVQQYVEETAIVEIEADTLELARVAVVDKLRDGDITNWEPGDDILTDSSGFGGVYAVKDENDELVWER
jgi:hypothetical protein